VRRLGALAGSACFAISTAIAQTQGPVLEYRVAVLQGLDKVTARVSTIRAPLDQPTQFGTLEVVARACRETPPTEPPESAAFLQIHELPPASDLNGRKLDLFSGWMFASSPAVSALEHPVYDIWVIDCAEPVAPVAGAQGVPETTPPSSE
jgi:hypothetical protein